MAEIKISELSIGDWVRVDDFDKVLIKRVSAIDGTRNQIGIIKNNRGGIYWYCDDEIEPIPLTPEILEKNGFVKEEDEDGNKRYSLIEGGTKFSLGYARSVFQWTFPIDVRFVHKLQNLLRFCGLKKEIEL